MFLRWSPRHAVCNWQVGNMTALFLFGADDHYAYTGARLRNRIEVTAATSTEDKMKRIVTILTGLTIVLGGQALAQDWAQWRGPNRDGAVASFTEPRAWPERLTQRWKVEVGLGYA